MGDRPLTDLNYGHPGAAHYHLDSGEWLFARQYTTRKWKQIPLQDAHKSETQVVKSSVHFPVQQNSLNITRIKKDIKSLIEDHPQLAPASAQLSELTLLSAAVQSATSIYDPLIGNLLSFGSITLEDKHEDPKQIAALPTGEGGNILRLAILTRERHSWASEPSCWVDGPSLKEAESGFWNEEAAPIRQICFAQSEDRSSLLAVRLPTRTVLFRPTYHRRRQSANNSPYYDLPPSIIDAHPVLSVGLDQTGGVSHTDISFNPDYQLQFGIVDQNHTWSVWDIEHGRKGDSYAVSCLVRGHLNPSQDASIAGEDGWSRILWVGDVNTLLVCNRRELSIFNIKGGSCELLPCPALVSKRSADWILDVKRHPRHKDRFFVLTSTRIVLMAIAISTDIVNSTAGEPGADILVSWEHYRSHEDFTLQLSVQLLSDDESCVIIYSRLNYLQQIYDFKDHASGSSLITTCSDPSVLDLTIDNIEHIKEIHLEPMQYSEIGQEMYGSELLLSWRKETTFYRLFLTLSDMSVHEVVLFTHKPSSNSMEGHDFPVEPFQQSIVRHSRRHFSRKEAVAEEDDFVIPNGPYAMADPKSRTVLQTPKWASSRHQVLFQLALDYTLLYNALLGRDISKEGLYDSCDIAVIISQVEEMFVNDIEASQLPLGTLLEFAGAELHVSDVDDASTKLGGLSTSVDGEDVSRLQPIAPARVLGLSEGEHQTITALYDIILQNWIAPLPPNVSIRVRQHKERLARRVAAEVMLASTRIRRSEAQEPISSFEPGRNQDSSVSLPVLPSKPLEGLQEGSSSQSLPTLLQSSIPSSSQPLSSPPPSSHVSPMPPDPLARLSRHLHIGEPSITPTIIPPTVKQLLAHWKPGTDPREYDWDITERALRPDRHDDISQQRRDKERRRRERKEKRQQREDEIMKAKASSQPIVLPRSSPGPMFGTSSQLPIQNSSQLPSSMSGFVGPGGLDTLIPMSQIEPGKFGGRQDRKKKKKGRISGF